jgi:two-component system, NtrC family, nitrogen regulation sensor histidine kinase NtrY
MFPMRSKTRSSRKSRPLIPFARRLLFSVLGAGFPAVALALVLLWSSSYALDHKLEGTAFTLLSWLGLSFSVQQSFIHSLRVLANVVSSIKEEDFSLRATGAMKGDALGELAIEINSLARALEEQRLGTLEGASLLRKVMTEAGTAIFAFAPDGRVHLVNKAATELLEAEEQKILHQTASSLGIEELLEGPAAETITRSFANIEKRWLVRRTWFRQHGIQHRLVVLSEASEALRAEERSAWQRLVRVLSHEINNSLAPIKSIARTLSRMPAIAALSPEALDQLKHGLEVIGSRAESLNRFLQNYAQLARLPLPNKCVFELKAFVEHVSQLELRLPVRVDGGPAVCVSLDRDQMEQGLINLIRNAVEAVLVLPSRDQVQTSVVVSWAVSRSDLELLVHDRGVGLPPTENLFVPFYTTKPTGAGIGLILCRQIVENHGGQLAIRNRKDGGGCEVVARIPGCILP